MLISMGKEDPSSALEKQVKTSTKVASVCLTSSFEMIFLQNVNKM